VLKIPFSKEKFFNVLHCNSICPVNVTASERSDKCENWNVALQQTTKFMARHGSPSCEVLRMAIAKEEGQQEEEEDNKNMY